MSIYAREGVFWQVNASNNAGDRPHQWAANMGHQAMMDFLLKVIAPVLVNM